jgi:hypothetical protein
VAETVVGAPDGVSFGEGAVPGTEGDADADGEAEGEEEADGEGDEFALRAGIGAAPGAGAEDAVPPPEADFEADGDATSGTLARTSSGNAPSRVGES